MDNTLLLIVICSGVQAMAETAARCRFARLKCLLCALLFGRLAGVSLGLFVRTEAYAGVLLPMLCLALGCCVTVLLSEALGADSNLSMPSGRAYSALLVFPLSLLAICCTPALTNYFQAGLFALSAAFTVLYPLCLRPEAPARVARSGKDTRSPSPHGGRRQRLRFLFCDTRRRDRLISALSAFLSLIPILCMICRSVIETALQPYYEAFWTSLQCGSLIYLLFRYQLPQLTRAYPGKLPCALLLLGLGAGLLLPF